MIFSDDILCYNIDAILCFKVTKGIFILCQLFLTDVAEYRIQLSV